MPLTILKNELASPWLLVPMHSKDDDEGPDIPNRLDPDVPCGFFASTAKEWRHVLRRGLRAEVLPVNPGVGSCTWQSAGAFFGSASRVASRVEDYD